MLQLSNGGIFLFPPVIWKFNYEFDHETLYPKINELFEKVKTNSLLENGNALSTVSLDQSIQPHTWSELKDFQFWLGEKIHSLRKEFSFYSAHSEVTQSWANRHYRTGETLEHTHHNSTFVASCYIKCPAGSGNIMFKDPLEYHKHAFPLLSEDSLYKEIPCATNDIIIFPGWLRHKTQINQMDQERIVITFNIK